MYSEQWGGCRFYGRSQRKDFLWHNIVLCCTLRTYPGSYPSWEDEESFLKADFLFALYKIVYFDIELSRFYFIFITFRFTVFTWSLKIIESFHCLCLKTNKSWLNKMYSLNVVHIMLKCTEVPLIDVSTIASSIVFFNL